MAESAQAHVNLVADDARAVPAAIGASALEDALIHKCGNGGSVIAQRGKDLPAMFTQMRRRAHRIKRLAKTGRWPGLAYAAHGVAVRHFDTDAVVLDLRIIRHIGEMNNRAADSALFDETLHQFGTAAAGDFGGDLRRPFALMLDAPGGGAEALIGGQILAAKAAGERNEFGILQSANRHLASGRLPGVVFGQNEPMLSHFHRELGKLTGVPDAPLPESFF